MLAATDPDAWILKAPARRKLGVGRETLERLIRSGAIRVRQIPGSFARASLADLERILAEAERPAAGSIAAACGP